MRFVTAAADAWRKNGPEVCGLLNGALPAFVTARRPKSPLRGVPVFSYHVVDAPEFLADLQFLSANEYRTLSGGELLEILEGALDLPPRTVVLTFDDGPRNFSDVAFPLLKRFGARAVAFIAPGLHADRGWPADEPRSGPGALALAHPTALATAHECVTEEREGECTQARPMTWQEIQMIHACGLVEFQSHTLESRFVPRWPATVPLAGCDPALERHRRRAEPLELSADLAASRREIQSRLPGARVDQLAFPMYIGTPNAVNAARGVGFRACYWGLIPGRPLNRRGDSPFYISRLSGEFVRRLPGTGRISLPELLHRRIQAVRAGRQWRQQASALSGASTAAPLFTGSKADARQLRPPRS